MESKITSDSPERSEHGGTLPRYREVLQACQTAIVEQFAASFKQMFEHMDDFMLGLAENAETNAARNHCFEVMHEILLKQPDIQRTFSSEIGRGFDNFAMGKAEPLRKGVENRKSDHLSLIEKDDYEISLAYTTILQRANTEFSAHLFALNHRLAIINGGIKLGEYNPALPGSPAQICDALQTAMDILDIPLSQKIRIALIAEFDRQVMRQAEKSYAGFNELLVQAGVLPNLSLEAIGYKPPTPQSGEDEPAESAPAPAEEELAPAPEKKAAAEPKDEVESSLDREIFSSIQEILARRHFSGPERRRPATMNVQTDLPHLMASLQTLQVSPPPTMTRQNYAELSLESVKEAFSAQLSRLSEIVQQQQVNSADADIIDLVGMLFEFILNDNTLPDSVKALLSHLHTPILKVALIDKKFFFRSRHPARRLLNVMTQAGALCNAEEGEEQGIFARMQHIVDQIVQNFEESTDIFSTLLEEFTEFLDGFNRKSKVVEKRSVESAKGKERLREARQSVSQEIVDRTWNRNLPKAVEELLMGPWANLLVLTNLRSGPESDEWKQGLGLIDDLLWSVEPKESEEEKQRVKQKLPKIEAAIRNGLAVIGDPEVNTNFLLQQLTQCHQEVLNLSAEEVAARKPTVAAKPAAAEPAPPPKAIWEDVEVTTPEEPEHPFLRDADPIMLAIVDELKAIKLGATFEFTDVVRNRKTRAKLSWYSPKTSYYIFVNQAGIQVAIKSLRTLAKEMRRGETRIVPPARKPLMDRALETIYSVLHSPDESKLAKAGDKAAPNPA